MGGQRRHPSRILIKLKRERLRLTRGQLISAATTGISSINRRVDLKIILRTLQDNVFTRWPHRLHISLLMIVIDNSQLEAQILRIAVKLIAEELRRCKDPNIVVRRLNAHAHVIVVLEIGFHGVTVRVDRLPFRVIVELGSNDMRAVTRRRVAYR